MYCTCHVDTLLVHVIYFAFIAVFSVREQAMIGYNTKIIQYAVNQWAWMLA
jgi:hypothetical protein